MNAHPCCQKSSGSHSNARHPQSWWLRAKNGAGFIIPSALLTVLPKCPVCLAAYVALGTGLSISYGSAQILMRALTVLCLGTLGLCAARCVVKYCLKEQAYDIRPKQTES